MMIRTRLAKLESRSAAGGVSLAVLAWLGEVLSPADQKQAAIGGSAAAAGELEHDVEGGARMVAGMNRVRRVMALEERNGEPDGVDAPIIIARVGESGDQAVARHVAEHGALTDANRDRMKVVVFIPATGSGRVA